MKSLEAINGKKIFLVEDDKFLTKIIKDKLTKAGSILNNCENGDDAISSLEQDSPDVILLDIMFPGGIDGFKVLEQIKSNDKLKSIPVIILSNLSEPSHIEKGMKLGAFRYIVKASIVPDEIIDHVGSAIISRVK